MNTQILSKCVEELKKETPNIFYILGMLETVIAMSEIAVAPVRTIVVEAKTSTQPAQVLNQVNEEELDASLALVGIGKIGKLN